MSTQVIFTTDPKLKRRVCSKLREDGITLKKLLNNCMKDYDLGKIRFAMEYEQEPEVEEINVTPEIQKKIDKIDEIINRKYARHL